MKPTNPPLPALRPDAPSLLRRAGNLIGAVQGIQQEASAEYWFERGVQYKAIKNWEASSYCLNKAVSANEFYWQAFLLNALAYANIGDAQKCVECFIDADSTRVIEHDYKFYQLLERVWELGASSSSEGHG